MQYLILLPGLIHVYIFVLESFLWGRPSTNKTFGLKPDDTAATKPLAFNQGFYNLFLAVAVLGGFSLRQGFPAFAQGAVAGQTVLLFGLGAIIAAGLVLLVSSPRLWRSALIQIVPAGVGAAAAFLS